MPTLPTPQTEGTGPAETPDDEEDVELPRECGSIVTLTDVSEALGLRLTGGVSPIFIDGGFHPDSGRLQRLTCSYNWVDENEDAAPKVVLEISVSLYVDDQHADDRVRDNVDSGGDVATMPGVAGFVLRSDEWATFVAAQDRHTYVARLLREAMRDSALEDLVLLQLAETMLSALPDPAPTSAD